jgi:hypothetical protein
MVTVMSRTQTGGDCRTNHAPKRSWARTNHGRASRASSRPPSFGGAEKNGPPATLEVIHPGSSVDAYVVSTTVLSVRIVDLLWLLARNKGGADGPHQGGGASSPCSSKSLSLVLRDIEAGARNIAKRGKIIAKLDAAGDDTSKAARE